MLGLRFGSWCVWGWGWIGWGRCGFGSGVFFQRGFLGLLRGILGGFFLGFSALVMLVMTKLTGVGAGGGEAPLLWFNSLLGLLKNNKSKISFLRDLLVLLFTLLRILATCCPSSWITSPAAPAPAAFANKAWGLYIHPSTIPAFTNFIFIRFGDVAGNN